jgi:CxxC-x17-CxxC domain-containing protein
VGFTDKQIHCVECGNDFTFTAAEQEFFSQKGYTNEPKRCLSCRQARKADRGGNAGGSRQNMQKYPAVCAQCGKETEVPFEPRQGRPVYCSSCYNQVRQNQVAK